MESFDIELTLGYISLFILGYLVYLGKAITINFNSLLGFILLLVSFYYLDNTLRNYGLKKTIYYYFISLIIIAFALAFFNTYNILPSTSYVLNANALKLIYSLYSSFIIAFSFISYDRFNIVSFIISIPLIYSYIFLGLIIAFILNAIEEKLLN